jgi:hypothetical protein
MWNRLKTSKTFWTGVAAIVSSVGMWYGGILETPEALGAIFAALQTIFIRDGIASASGKAGA